MMVLTAFVGYFLLGFIFCIAFLLVGIHRLDAGAKDTGMGFKLLITPGIIVLWPYLLKKWLTSKS